MIRIREGIVFLSNETITLASANTAITEMERTIAGSNFAVTAKAEQIPST